MYLFIISRIIQEWGKCLTITEGRELALRCEWNQFCLNSHWRFRGYCLVAKTFVFFLLFSTMFLGMFSLNTLLLLLWILSLFQVDTIHFSSTGFNSQQQFSWINPEISQSLKQKLTVNTNQHTYYSSVLTYFFVVVWKNLMKRFIPLFNLYQGGPFRGKYTWCQQKPW